jgi:hypothetical protein
VQWGLEMTLVLLLLIGLFLGFAGSRLELSDNVYKVAEYVLAFSVIVIVFVVGNRAGSLLFNSSDWVFVAGASGLFVSLSIVFSLLAGIVVWVWVKGKVAGTV